jgi:LAO/AO transport system kinase
MMTGRVFAEAVGGDRRALARAISLIDDRADGVLAAIAGLSPRRATGPGSPHVVGITGPPGSGKSTLTDRLITLARAQGSRVAVVAVDPSSPFTGGAILGDRLRMEDHATDPDVFVRSLASRGHVGGLSRAPGQVVALLDAAGFGTVIVETVGVGQSELAVMEVADTVVVVLTPESGDVVQTMKAGLLEVADVFVVNKADRPGAPRLQRHLELAVELDGGSGWAPPVLVASATENDGIDALVEATAAHLDWCVNEGRAGWADRRAAGRVRTFLDLVGEDARTAAATALGADRSALRQALESGEQNPYAAAAAWADR